MIENGLQISENNGISMTNEQLYLNTVRVAQNMTKLGLKINDVIGIVGDNHNLSSIIFAAMSIGCPTVALAASSQRSDIVHVFSGTKPKMILCTRDNVTTVLESTESMNLAATLYTFDESTAISRCVDELLAVTNEESEFVYV